MQAVRRSLIDALLLKSTLWLRGGRHHACLHWCPCAREHGSRQHPLARLTAPIIAQAPTMSAPRRQVAGCSALVLLTASILVQLATAQPVRGERWPPATQLAGCPPVTACRCSVLQKNAPSWHTYFPYFPVPRVHGRRGRPRPRRGVATMGYERAAARPGDRPVRKIEPVAPHTPCRSWTSPSTE